MNQEGNKPQNEAGQASIFLGIMSITFIGLFIFVVNTGLLVSAKINLQNAADLAAYAGAAVQARTLNEIAFLNYEMRRQYKKFLFRYYVLGNMNQKSHSEDIANGAPKRTWRPSSGALSYGVPTICMAFGSDNNICQVDRLQPLTKIQANPIDAIGATLKAQFETLEQFRQQNCRQLTTINEMAAKLWLYNTDPDVQQLRQAIAAAVQTGNTLSSNSAKAINALQGYSTGLGLVPRLTLLAKRIKTLEEYLNAPANRRVEGATLTQLQNFPDQPYRERTIQAYLSAFNTLGGPGSGEANNGDSGHAFVDGSLVLDELLPSSGDGAALARLRPIRTEMDVFYSTLDPVNSQDGACIGQPTQIKVPNLTVAFEKDPSILTYYAVRLEASYKPMFFPRTPIPMRAYAAARPFGSRIGPSANLIASQGLPAFTALREVATPPGGVNPTGGLSNQVKIPNLPVTRGETPGGIGWESSAWIGALYGTLIERAGGSNPVIGPQDVERAFQVAMVPNPVEKGLYAIPNDASEDPFQIFFDGQGFHPIWAPLRSPAGLTGQGQDPKEEIREAVQQAVGGGARADAFAEAINGYFSKLSTPKGGESGEDIRTVALKDPTRFVGLPGEAGIRLGDNFFMKSPSDLKTSWSDIKNIDYRAKGRVGYSVKFVSLGSLINPRETVDGLSSFTNTLQETDPELESLKH